MAVSKPPIGRILAVTVLLFILGLFTTWAIVRQAGEGPERLYGVVKVWFLKMPDVASDALRAEARAYDEEQPDHVVRVREMGRRHYTRTLSLEVLANTPVSLYHSDPGRRLDLVVREQKAMAVQAGPVAELTEQIHPALLTLGRSGDELYALPLEASFAVFWYDRAVFERLGLEPPRTWEELLAACDRLREAGLVPIALGNRGRWPVLLYYGYLVDRLGVRGLLDEAVQGTSAEGIRDARFARAWQRLRELAQAGAFPEGAAEMTDVEAIKMFFEGRAGMYLGTTTTGYRCQRAAPELVSRLDCFPFPVMAGAEEPTTPTFLGTSRLNMVIWPNAPTVDHAGAVLRRFASRDVAEALARGGRVPTLKDSLDTELLPEPTRRAVTLLDAPGTRLEPYLDVHLVTSVSDTLLEEGAAVLAGRTTPEDAAAAVAEQVEELAKSRRHSPGQQ